MTSSTAWSVTFRAVMARVLTLYGTAALDDASLVDHCFGKSRLAATRTAKQSDVFDFVCLIDLHII